MFNSDIKKYIVYNPSCRSLVTIPGFLNLTIPCCMRLAQCIAQDARTKAHSRKVTSGGS